MSPTQPVTAIKPRRATQRPSDKKRRRRAQILGMLPATQLKIHRRTKIGLSTVSRWLNDLVDSEEAHVGDWERSKHGGPFAAVYHKGPGEPVPCTLEPIPGAVVSRSYHDRRRKERAAELAEREARLAALVPRRDPMVAALFGAA